MRSLYLRIYATVVVVLLLFALGSGWIVEQHIDQQRVRNELVVNDRLGGWAELIGRSLPGADAPADEQAAALRDWSTRLRVPLALDDVAGTRIVASDSFVRRTSEGIARSFAFRLDDGRTLHTMRPGMRQGAGRFGAAGRAASGDERPARLAPSPAWSLMRLGFSDGASLVLILVVLFVAVAAGAYPVVRRLTRRLEALKQGVEQFGQGRLAHRVAVSGSDEVAAVASSFNVAAARVEALVESHRSLLANASHELRSPLARMRMAVSMLDDAGPERREKLKAEIDRNVAELDALVEEVLLASRLDAAPDPLVPEPVDLLGVAAEEAARVGANVDSPAPVVAAGDEKLLRRAARNLLENAKRYGGGGPIDVVLAPASGVAAPMVSLAVCDRGPGVPPAMRERIFESFFRLPGHAEQAGGVGLGLALVKQIAERHGGRVRCEARSGGGSRFVLEVPAFSS